MTEKFPDIERNKTVLSLQACPSCGRNNTVRMNASDRAYWACKWPTGDDGAQCRSERRFSDTETAQIVRAFNQTKLKMKGRNNGDENDSNQPAGKPAGVYDFYAD